jgi:hypothetical protein
LWLAGCGRANGPARYELSGSVTYNGKPVPAGFIVFAPDTSRGNNGPGATATIENGVYRTPTRAGTIGGPHIATISGSSSMKVFQQGPMRIPQSRPLFTNVEFKVDLPKESSTHDFAVPDQGR